MNEMVEVKLKPCPFCAGKPQMRTWDFPYVRYQVRCSECKAATRSRLKSWLEAEEAWNTRSALKQKAEPVAWQYTGEDGDECFTSIKAKALQFDANPMPLYTAPPSTAEAQIGDSLKERLLGSLLDNIVMAFDSMDNESDNAELFKAIAEAKRIREEG